MTSGGESLSEEGVNCEKLLISSSLGVSDMTLVEELETLASPGDEEIDLSGEPYLTDKHLMSKMSLAFGGI